MIQSSLLAASEPVACLAPRGRCRPIAWVSILAVLLCAQGLAHAQWQPGGAPVCTARGNQQFPAMVADGSGGAFIAWDDNRDSASTGQDIYIQRLDSGGMPLWTPNGVAVCTLPTNQWNTHTVADGAGGVIVVWEDNRNGPRQLYAQQLDAFGVPEWEPNGILVSTGIWPHLYGPGHARAPSIATDGAGGAIIVWEEYVTGFDWDVWAQRVRADGSLPWGPRGVPISLANSFQVEATVAADGLGGAVITWEDWREHPVSNAYAQRVDSSGTTLWTTDGVAVSGPGQHYRPLIVSPGPGYAVVAWYECSPQLDDIVRAQRIDPSGSPEWSPGGVEVAHAPGPRLGVALTLDGSGGVTVAWQDGRTCGALGTCEWDAYAQRVDTLGQMLWAPNGVLLHQITEDQQYAPKTAPDGTGGAIVVWTRRVSGFDLDLSFQHVDAGGTPDLAPDGVPLEGPGVRELKYSIVSDGAGGAIVVWQDDRNGAVGRLGEVFEGDLYATHIPAIDQVDVDVRNFPNPTLAPPRPNPMGNSTEISFHVNTAAPVTLEVFNVTGQRVRSLAAGVEFGGGMHRLSWDGRDDAGRPVPTGMYIILLSNGGRQHARRVIVLR